MLRPDTYYSYSEWLSFLNHDLPNLMDISDPVEKIAVRLKINRKTVMKYSENENSPPQAAGYLISKQ